MDEILYVHVRWPDGADDMMPESVAQIRADAGDFTIVDPKPGRWRAFKPRLPLGTRLLGAPDPDDEPATGTYYTPEPADPDGDEPAQTATDPVGTETAPEGAQEAEEATE